MDGLDRGDGRSAVLAGPSLAGLAAVAVATGASALVLQVTWHRVITLHAGIDLAASTTVVVAFLLGLGVGNLVGGRLADRLTPRGALGAMAGANALLALYALISIVLLYDVYRDLAGATSSVGATLAFNTVVLLPATVLFGVSLPLVARAVTGRISQAGRLVGRFNALNTLGAAVGAMVGGWRLVGEYGFVSVTRLCAAVHVGAAVALAAMAMVRSSSVPAASPLPGAGAVPDAVEDGHSPWSPRRWYLIYAGVGAVALGYEQVFFRLVDGVLRSNAYTFAHVLGLYLGLWAIGAAAGSVLLRRVADPRRWFLWMQFSVGVGALLSLIALVHLVPLSPLAGAFETWFSGPGMTAGLPLGGDRLLFGLLVPVSLMAVPVLLFGASFPFAEALTARDLSRLGRTTGRLVGSNLAGNVVGTLVAAFVLIEHLGTAGAVVVLSLPMLAAGLVAAGLAPRGRVRRQRLAVAATALALIVATPSNSRLWATLLGVSPPFVVLAEDRACASALLTPAPGAPSGGLVINGRGQNGYPFDNFHVMIGLLPALAHPDPRAAVAIGFGIGSTSYGLLASERVGSVTSVEICPGNYDLADELADRGAPEFVRLRDDPSHDRRARDGRKHLLTSHVRYDLVVPDTLLPSSAGSNNVYSQEFFELARDSMDDDGILAIWSASGRVDVATAATFPYVVRVDGDDREPAAQILLASRSPIDLDRATLSERFDATAADAFTPEQRAALSALLADLTVECINDGEVQPPPDPESVNRDLRPRDEYFLNHHGVGPDVVQASCGA